MIFFVIGLAILDTYKIAVNGVDNKRICFNTLQELSSTQKISRMFLLKAHNPWILFNY